LPVLRAELANLALGSLQLFAIYPVVLGLKSRSRVPAVPPEPEHQRYQRRESNEQGSYRTSDNGHPSSVMTALS
jgi:hypothetical protein